ncbi:hypothetical protein CQA49_06820 [Helicobacter sp. MIT 00-7814]|uniref:ParM/StbA family protein n=1 Tax=unclassified Helicobacter TaxID=2593540 RepID=UPI000E1F5036|nr:MULTISPECIES: ParM/StbA family protein [unclassified Helicobacter]RDU53354.1 hypothetical protein CQA49_06820 [Helicobacter sp. MIT 00-7814]RDU54175.1 hypothetical protein CQA37_06060 [Helicobacter sp. MIT 99-10781]
MKLGIDTGFGHTKYCFKNKKGDISLKKFPSVVALCPDDIEEDESICVMDGKNYYVGSLALKQDFRLIKEISTYKDLELYAPLLIEEIRRKENLKPSDIEEITVGLALAHKSHAESFKKRLEHFTINDKDYNIKVTVIPQGVGAVKALQDFWKGKEQEPQDYILVDIGFSTVDIVLVYDGVIQKGRLNEANSFEKKGVVQIAESMQKHIKEKFNTNITNKEALKIIVEGKYKLRGEEHDLSSYIDELKKAYTQDIMNFLESKYSNEIDKLDAFIFVGGGGYFIDTQYTKHIRTFKNSEYYNAIGNLLAIEPMADNQKVSK